MKTTGVIDSPTQLFF